jgi:hypothetical protein
MPITKPASEVTEEDKINCICTRGHAGKLVTLYYEGEEAPEIEWADEALKEDYMPTK